MERIFAFDVLIRNADRRVGKPNFLLFENTPVLIDHELSLRISKTFPDYFAGREWGFLSGNSPHIFLGLLRAKSKNVHLDFTHLSEYFRTLNPPRLFSFAEQLLDFDYDDAENVVKIVDYLESVKNNPVLFFQLIREILQ